MPVLKIVPPLIVLALLAYMISQTDLEALGRAFANVSAAHVFIGLGLVQLQIVLSALRWRFTASRLGQEIGVSQAVNEYYVASVLNQSLPGGMGGDAVRAWRMRTAGPGGWKQPAKAVLFERLSGQAAFFILAALGLFVWPFVLGGDEPGRLALMLVGSVLALIALFAGLLVAARHSFRARVEQMANDLRQVFVSRNAWAIQGGLSLAVVLAYVAVFMLASHGVGASLPYAATVTIIPLCLLSMLIPAGLGGWGTREAAAMALWPILGASSADGLAASLLYGALSLAGAVPGLVVLTLGALKGRPRSA